ncbi:MAG: PKD domain-containing protein, partial [Caldimonas sp.]
MANWQRAAGALLVTAAISGCGGGGSAPASAPNTAPTANFAFSCVDLVCTFTSLSTDQDVGDAIVAQSWSFGDGQSNPVTTATAQHTYAAASSYDVTLMVGDRGNAVSSATRRVTVTTPPVPAAPHASFTASCVS